LPSFTPSLQVGAWQVPPRQTSPPVQLALVEHGAATHDPELHAWLAAQTTPHPPQFDASLEVLTHAPEHRL
jgi:hypothetical protein